MKRLLLVVMTLFAVITLSACSDVCVGTTCVQEDPEPTTGGVELDNVISYDHINGEGHVVEDHNAYILFEYEMQGYVKYQVSFLACTCRPADINFWSVMYIEVNKYTNDVKYISFGLDNPESDHPYSPGSWGDSSPTPAGKTQEDFQEMYVPWFYGKSLEDLDGISIFKNDTYHGTDYNTVTIDDAVYTDPDTGNEINLIDDFANSSVSTNNILRVVKSTLEYHEENYN